MAENYKDDGMQGGADPCGSQGGPTGSAAFRTGNFDGDADGDGNAPGHGFGPGDPDNGGYPGGGSDVVPPAGTSTAAQPRPEEWIK